MVDFRRKLDEMRAAKSPMPLANPDVTIPAPMDNVSPKLGTPEPQPTKLFRITVRIEDTTDAPPKVEQEVVGYDITNTTDKNYVLRKLGEAGKSRLNLPKTRVGGVSPVIRRAITVGDNMQVWVASETWVYGNVDTYIGIVENDIIDALTTVSVRAKRIQDQIKSDD